MIEQLAKVTEHDVKVTEALASKVVDTRGDAFEGRVTPSSWAEAPRYRERKEFGQAFRTSSCALRERLQSIFGPHNAGYPAPLKFTVEIAGLEWDAQLRSGTRKTSTILLSCSRLAGRSTR